MSSNVYLRVFGLKGITPRMVNNHPKGKVWCRAELGDTKLETVKIGVGGGSLAVNEVRACCGGGWRGLVFSVCLYLGSIFKLAANVACSLCLVSFTLLFVSVCLCTGWLEYNGRLFKVGDEPRRDTEFEDRATEDQGAFDDSEQRQYVGDLNGLCARGHA